MSSRRVPTIEQFRDEYRCDYCDKEFSREKLQDWSWHQDSCGSHPCTGHYIEVHACGECAKKNKRPDQ